MNKDAAHISGWKTLETLFVIALLLSLFLNYLFPLSLSTLLPRPVSIGGGLALIMVGLIIIVKTRIQFRQASQPTDPGHPTTQLITTGPFSWSRNPLYLAGGIIFLGLAALLNSLWMLIVFIPFLTAVHYILIVPEENYLEGKFEELYNQYARSVRRWIGKHRQF